MRDEFGEDVKRLVAARAGHLCSSPTCRALTSGPRVDPSKSLNVGVAAHITAASPGGPRYDLTLSSEERRHVNNAIWLCQTCAKLIDNDESRYTTSELREWKRKAEAEALARVGKPTTSAPGSTKPYITATAPAPPPKFIGRHQHLRTLLAAFSNNDSVSYAMLGMGGVGKTATAKKLAAELALHFAGGIFWGSLADYDGNPVPILHNWARTCLEELPSDVNTEGLAHLVRGILTNRQHTAGRLLIVIDDVRDQWLEAGKLLRRALPHTASLLVTARNQAVATALDTVPYQLEAMPPNEALQLLETYAGNPLSTVDKESARTLVKIIGYLPLAIELTGKRLLILSRKPGNHLNQLRQLVEARAVETLALPGHKGLAATFAVTYEALSIEEQRLFRWLGIFAEGSLELVNVAGVFKVEVSRAEDLLDSLVAAALLTWGETMGGYTLHPLLHQYAKTLLLKESTAEAAEAGREHMSYYLTLAQANARELPTAHAELENNLPDILGSIKFAEKEENHAAVNQFLRALWADGSFLPRRGYMHLALELLPKAITASRKLGDRLSESIHVGHLGVVHANLGPSEQAIENYERALSICREIGNRYDECAHLGNLGMAYEEIGQIDLAVRCYQEAADIAGEVGNFDAALDQLGNLAGAYRHLGMRNAAKKHYEEGINLSRKSNRRLDEGNNLSNLGLIYFDLKYYGIAWSYVAQALAISREIGDRKGEGNRLGHLGNILVNIGEPRRSIDYYKQAIDIGRRIGHRINEGNWAGNLGNAYRSLGRIDDAIAYYEKALDVSRELNFPEGQGIWLLNLGITYHDLGQLEKARDYLSEAVKMFRINKSHNLTQAEDLLAGLSRDTVRRDGDPSRGSRSGVQ
jgi:tetratricopeptide (TPR) repeat protein